MEWVLLALVGAAFVVAAMTDREGRFRGFGGLATRLRTRRLRRAAWATGDPPTTRRRSLLVRTRAAADVWPPGLSPVAQARYTERWRRAQLRFVYEPAEAVKEADGLVDELLRLLGYQPGALDPGEGKVPVPSDLLADYMARAFHAAGRSDDDVASLRERFVRDKALFDELVAAAADAVRTSPRPSTA
ncbi:MAG TPA: hypothetical protein VIL48_08405 [Acidimicrobiales bacterium]